MAACLVAGTLSAADAPKPRVPITPQWALECWLWEDDDSTAAAITELLDGYAEHDIPARTVILDAPWSTRYNDFHFDTKRYPEPEKFIRQLKQRGVRVVMWMTCMVNSENNDTAIKDAADWFQEAKAKGYLAGGGYEQKWWHGWGGFVDYMNPEAMKWWHGMQQQVYDMGIDGWKLDDAAFYFNSPIGSMGRTRNAPPASARKNWPKNRDYVDHFYRDEYQHGLAQRGGDFITLARSIDNRLYPKGFAPLDAAPVTWVGDQNHTWKASEEGIEEAAPLHSRGGPARLLRHRLRRGRLPRSVHHSRESLHSLDAVLLFLRVVSQRGTWRAPDVEADSARARNRPAVCLAAQRTGPLHVFARRRVPQRRQTAHATVGQKQLGRCRPGRFSLPVWR